MVKKIFLLLSLILMSFSNLAYSDETDPNSFVDSYGQEVQAIIKSNLKYQGLENATTAVTYKIHPDGSVTDIKLEKPSGTGFDQAVIQAVQKSAPFKPFPKGSNISDIVMTSGFQHQVKKYQSVRMSIMPVEPTNEAQQSYKKYMDNVGKIFFDHIPTIYDYIPNEPVVSCVILQDGSVTNVKVEKSSGIPEYDAKIIETYSKIKLPQFPQELSGYKQLPYSARLYRQYRFTPPAGNPSIMFR